MVSAAKLFSMFAGFALLAIVAISSVLHGRLSSGGSGAV